MDSRGPAHRRPRIAASPPTHDPEGSDFLGPVDLTDARVPPRLAPRSRGTARSWVQLNMAINGCRMGRFCLETQVGRGLLSGMSRHS